MTPARLGRRPALLLLALLLAAGDAPPRGSVAIIAINDVYRIGGPGDGRTGGLARVRALRDSLERAHGEVLLLHGGDALFPSLMSRTFGGAQMIDALNLMDGDAGAFDSLMVVVFGNHEFDDRSAVGGAFLNQRVRESGFWWVAANIESATLSAATHANVRPSLILDVSGVRVGIFGLTLGPDDVSYAVIRDTFPYLRRRAGELSAELRTRGAQVVIALTHLDLATDRQLLELGSAGPDLIIGGHEHDRQAAQVRGRWVLKADSDARSATVVRVTPRGAGQAPAVRADTVLLTDATIRADRAVAQRVDWWTRHHDQVYCYAGDMAPGCLDTPVGRAVATLAGEELAVRGGETNLGGWVADRLRAAVDGADIAFINAGALRLNQNLPAGTAIRLRDVEELIQYDNPLLLLDLPRETVQAMLEHAASCIGQGAWLQVSGLTFTVDYGPGPLVRNVKIGQRPLAQVDAVRAVTVDFLVNDSTRDGFRMLGPHLTLPGPAVRLKRVVLDALRATPSVGLPSDTGRVRVLNRQQAAGVCPGG